MRIRADCPLGSRARGPLESVRVVRNGASFGFTAVLVDQRGLEPRYADYETAVLTFVRLIRGAKMVPAGGF